MEPLCEMLGGVTRSWLSVVMNSDAFKAEYAKRRAEYSSVLAEGVQLKLHEVALKGLERLDTILDYEELDPRFVLDAVDKTTHKLGFSPSGGNRPAVSLNQTNISVTTPETLQVARELMRRVVQIDLVPDACEE
jgi:hypothetical protein